MDHQQLIRTARAELAEDLAVLTPQQWATPSLCEAWSVEETVAHLTSAAHMTTARWVRSIVAAGLRPAVHNRRRLTEHLGPTSARTFENFRAVVPSDRAPSKHTAAWLGEVLVHGQDVRRPLCLPQSFSVPAWSVVAEFFAARNFAVNSRTVARGLRLRALDGPFDVGDGPEVVGPTQALTMVMAGRRAYLDDLDGVGVSLLRARL